MMTLDPGIVGLCSPDAVRPGATAARTPEWQSTAVVWVPGDRQKHSNDFTSWGEVYLSILDTEG